MKVTMEQVAQKAGVSKALVSRFLNEKPGVSEKSRIRIKDAIDDLHYRLPGVRSGNVIALVLDGVSSFHAPLLSACSAAALAEGYVMTIVDCFDNNAVKEKTADLISQGSVQGVLLYGSSISDKTMIDIFIQNEIPLVLIENNMPGVDVEKILIDNFQGQHNITKYVIDRGFTDIRMIPWDLSTRAGAERLAGFLAALREHEVMTGNSYVCPPERPGFQGVFDIVSELRSLHNLPEVFVCSGDTIATYVLASCVKLGIKVPEELSVTGFDGLSADIFAAWGPCLTTMRQPLSEMGGFAVKRLLRHIENPGEPPMKRMFHTELVVGETVGLMELNRRKEGPVLKGK
ncbi:MAG: LacI family transcriptional regulator [Treponema sp.]|jgi:LacI family transcriptional regulator|nr:LacI family transcriptional regulator [Treponema sp.]